MKNYFNYSMEFLNIYITEEEGSITGIYFNEPELMGFNKNESKEILLAKKQIDEYFIKKRKTFDFNIKFNKGTDFQKSVWNALLMIPYGETKSYKDIAVMVGSSKAYRAVGLANNKNPISIVVPCHRVIGADGGLVGYGGGLSIKKRLLELEGIKFN